MPGYLRSITRRERADGPRHILLCVADHFEPFDRTINPDGSVSGGVSSAEARELTHDWLRNYRESLANFRDADGCPPRHTFFYAWDEYDVGVLDDLAAFSRDGFGEVEVHLHHRNDTADGLRRKLEECRDTFAEKHGLLGRIADGSGATRAAYAFVHGNWCLCDARRDGDWCGVNRELAVLAETGCYADLTFPSAPSETQPRFVNEIVYGRDPEAGERGVQPHRRLVAGKPYVPGEGELLLIPGPLGLNWQSRKFGLLPRLENAELSGVNPPTAQRLRLWMEIGVHVPGRPEWCVVKLHTHGACPANAAMLTGEPMAQFHRELQCVCTEESGLRLHYVTARELFNIVKAAEAGRSGNPGQYRDFTVKLEM